VTSTLQAWFTQAGVGVIAIGSLSLVGLPYVWKFVWAPFMDRFVPPYIGKSGRRRGWILTTQAGLCVALLCLGGLNPAIQPAVIGGLALLIAFLSASQDIAIDAYRTDVLHPEERGVGAATFIFAYRMALLVSGGLGLILADYFGWRFTYQLMAILIGLSIIATYFSPAVEGTDEPPNDIFKTITGSFGDLFKRDAIGLLLLFVIFYKLGDALALSLMSNFLLHGLGFSLTQIGVAYKMSGLIATIVGTFSGGILLVWLGLYRSLWFFGIAQACSTLIFVLLAIIGKNIGFMVFSIFIENFCSGMGTAAFVAFLTGLCHHRYSATQYACLSALAAIGRVCLGPVAGMMVLHLGWVSFYAWSFALSFPGLLLLGLLRNRVRFNAEMVEC
jgi:PAT family beta-lactamase induction signal transducer AmpG